MLSYDKMVECLEAYKEVEPAGLDALAWAGIVGGALGGDKSGGKNGGKAGGKNGGENGGKATTAYLEHFLDKDVGNDPDANKNIHKIFADLIAHNASSLEEGAIEFLLPDDDCVLAERLRTLALWCETFVSALGISPHLKDKALESKVKSHLHDLIEMSKMDTSSSEDYDNPEEANIDYMELYEFLRATIISLDLEFKHFTKKQAN